MMSKEIPPFRAEHLGSFLRPEYLLETRKQFEKGEVSLRQLIEVEDRAVAEAVGIQREVGLKSFTDGEYRRHIFYEGFFEYLQGFEQIHDPPLEIFKLYVPDVRAFISDGNKPETTLMCVDKIQWVKSGYVPQFEAVKKLVHPDEVKNIKMTLASPSWFHLRYGDHAFERFYANREEYFNDFSVAYRKELEALYAAGCRNVQIDDAHLSFFCDASMINGMKDEGTDPEALFNAYIQLNNSCLTGRRRDMTVGVHLCRGNYRKSVHFAKGGYDVIAARLFKDLDVDSYYLEYDTERAGTFEPLRHLPKHKSLVLGIVSSKFPKLEDKALLRERVYEAARIVASGTPGETVEGALQRISVSPQCGFASHEDGNSLTMDDMKCKLQLVKDVADSIWADV